MKKILAAIAIVIVLLGVGVWVYVSYFAGSATPATTATSTSTLLPIAGNTEPIVGPSETVTPSTTPEPVAPQKVSARLVQIDKGPVVSGAVAYDIGTSSPDIAINYLERQSGNIFQYLVHAGTLTRTSNHTIPGIQEAAWLPNGSIAYLRYLSGTDRSTINTYALPANGIGGYFLAQNINSFAAAPTSLLALASGASGSVATLTRPDGSHSSRAFDTPLTSLRTSFLGKAQYLAFTKPSATLAGYAFLVNQSGGFERIAGPLSGLVALASPSGKFVLLSYVTAGALKTSLLNVTTRELLPLPLGTVADKCVWTTKEDAIYCGVPVDPSNKFAYPDDWYQGAVSFNDRIWKISVGGRFAELVLDFQKETKAQLDATALAIDPSAKVLVFRNKNDGSLWSYEL